MKHLLPFILFLSVGLGQVCSQKIYPEVPTKPDPSAKYIFYFHGAFLENNPLNAAHPEYGKVEYDKIKQAFSSNGFTIITEQREKGTDVEKYASKISAQIKDLISKGIPPHHITVVGGSKGSYIAQFVSTQLQNKYINYVIIAACNEKDTDKPSIHLSGNVLSIYEASDSLGQSCQYLKNSATLLNEFKEVKVSLGIKHKIVYQPYVEWVSPTIEWANHFATSR